MALRSTQVSGRGERNEPGSKAGRQRQAIEPAAVATLWQPRRFYVNALRFTRAQLLYSDPDPVYF